MPAVRFPGIPAVADGSEAVAHVETRVAEAACADPIAPSLRGAGSPHVLDRSGAGALEGTTAQQREVVA